MKHPDSIKQAILLAKASTADVYAWGSGYVLKLFHEHTPFHALEVAATRTAYEAHHPVPKVIDGLIEIDGREGIIFERIEGTTMAEYIEQHPQDAGNCAMQAAKLHAQVHSTEVAELPLLTDILSLSIQQAGSVIDEKICKVVLDVLIGLPAGSALCHNDFYPNNIIMSLHGPVIIDWAIGTRGNPLADIARSWLISKMWLSGLVEKSAPEHLQHTWKQFWKTYFLRYGELRAYNMDELNKWQIVAATASLVWGPPVTLDDERKLFISAALGGHEHGWLKGEG